MIPRLRLPASRKMITLEVRERVLLSPNFASVTLGGPALKDLIVAGTDQTVRLFFPREGQSRLRMPTFSNEAWMPEVMMMPKSVRPWVRTLTIRRARPADDEIDIEFALHENSPMSDWARGARPGDAAGIFDMGTTYRPPDDVGGQLIVADESALPAALAILDDAPESLVAEVFLEVPTVADIRRYDTTEGVRVHWLSRDDPERRPGTLVLETVRRAALPPGRFYTWVAGESRLATSLRRHLVSERGAAKADISFAGYWRHGWSSPG
ncbi:siderophore-interacting protein [Amycolatopsis azurea]|uniref:Putative siderophore interacting protein n=1 Tax=Amycolatopsis azurea DSM 43854 TaxID=1238180 RepID=M2NQY4_9PSEU|nr:siderophore-interacting protein [Amycolatopsis azurea]EMD24724.1 putative siderophore interacting protein [Amycolatopsis azurea DSM 43854]OOC08217.1 siderophore-interacting protein [Amycolatopsis azurea DSM 43854]